MRYSGQRAIAPLPPVWFQSSLPEKIAICAWKCEKFAAEFRFENRNICAALNVGNVWPLYDGKMFCEDGKHENSRVNVAMARGQRSARGQWRPDPLTHIPGRVDEPLQCLLHGWCCWRLWRKGISISFAEWYKSERNGGLTISKFYKLKLDLFWKKKQLRRLY